MCRAQARRYDSRRLAQTLAFESLRSPVVKLEILLKEGYVNPPHASGAWSSTYKMSSGERRLQGAEV
jgi:hypothetical protein